MSAFTGFLAVWEAQSFFEVLQQLNKHALIITLPYKDHLTAISAIGSKIKGHYKAGRLPIHRFPNFFWHSTSMNLVLLGPITDPHLRSEYFVARRRKFEFLQFNRASTKKAALVH